MRTSFRGGWHDNERAGCRASVGRRQGRFGCWRLYDAERGDVGAFAQLHCTLCAKGRLKVEVRLGVSARNGAMDGVADVC